MAEVGRGNWQVIAPVTGTDYRLGTGLTFPHPLGAQNLVDRMVGRVCISNPITNAGVVTISKKASAGTSKTTLQPGQAREWVAYNPGERYRLGDFYVTTVGAETAEVDYTLR